MIILLKRPTRWYRARHGESVNPRTGKAYPHSYMLYDTDRHHWADASCKGERTAIWSRCWHGGLRQVLLDGHYTVVKPVGDIMLPEGM